MLIHASSTVILMRRVVVIPVRARAITPFPPRSRRRSRSIVGLGRSRPA
jgi:hypothetical protein